MLRYLLLFLFVVNCYSAVIFPGEFSVAGNWSQSVNKGSISFDTSSIVIIGGNGTSHNMDVNSMTYTGASNSGVTQNYKITFHYTLQSNNRATAYFINGNTKTKLTVSSGDITAYIPQYGTFSFELDNMLYRRITPIFTISQFVVAVPESDYIPYAAAAFIIFVGYRRKHT